MNPSLATFITKAAALASDKIIKAHANNEEFRDKALSLAGQAMLNNNIKSITGNRPKDRVIRHVLNSKLNSPHYNKDLYKKIRTDFQSGTGAANPVGTDDAFYKQEREYDEGVLSKKPVSVAPNPYWGSNYNPYQNQIQINPINHNDITVLGHEIGHAQDPLLESQLKYTKDISDEIVNTVNGELRASENGRRMLRDGYGLSDDIAKGAYSGVPTHIASFLHTGDSYDPVQAAFNRIYSHEHLPFRIKPYTPITVAAKRTFMDKGFNPAVKQLNKQWSPEAINTIRDFENKMELTPESVARRFTEAITSTDPIKRRLETNRMNDRAKRVNMENFASDESAYNAFMPKIPEAKPSGSYINGKPIPNNWQPVRTNSIYND